MMQIIRFKEGGHPLATYRERLQASLRFALVVTTVVGMAMGLSPMRASGASSGESASLDQCANGQVSPLTPQPCVGSNASGVSVAISGINSGAAALYKNWVNGNVNGSKAHWREGEFIAYRAIVSGLPAGSHTLVFTYDTVHGGLHATDYLGSYDATETTSASPGFLSSLLLHANNNSPCADLVAAGTMDSTYCTTAYNTSRAQTAPAVPAATVAAPSENFGAVAGGEQGCGGAPGTFVGTQAAGTIDFFGPVASGPTASILTDNASSGTGQCTTTVTLTFTTTADLTGKDMVVAMGGHISSQLDWGTGHSASNISGSPFHMSLVSLDGASTGSQDRALATSAIIFVPTLATTICNASNTSSCTAVTSPAPIGTSVYDSASLSGANATAGGSVTYHFFANNSCNTSATTGEFTGFPQTVTVSYGIVPNSASTGSLGPGSYYFYATYSGDPNDTPVTSPCEPLTVGPGSSTISTTVFDAATNAAWSGSETAGASAYDTATVSVSSASFSAAGTVAWTFYTSSDCTTGGTSAGSSSVSAAGVLANNSTTEGPLAAGSYSFKATYTPTSNFAASTSSCEPFTVGPGSSTISTTVFDAATNAAWSGSETAGASAYDTSTVTPSNSFVASGTVTYTFFGNSACSGSGTAAGTVTLTGTGAVPKSNTEGPLAAGSYSFQAVYSGDSNYAGSTSPCEPFSVTAPPHVSQIAPTGTTCSQFSGNTAGTLSTVQYSLKNGVINQTDPGVFFYWVTVTVSGAGAQTFTITQSINPTFDSHYFMPAAGSFAYDGSCNKLTTIVTQSGNTTTVNFTAAAAGTYFIGIKYSTRSIDGAAVTGQPTFTYTFTTTGVAGSDSSIALAPK